MDKPNLLPIIEAQITQWDCWASERARAFLADVLRHTEASQPVDIDLAFELPCQDLAAMALESLVKATGYSADDFESISDCQHMKFSPSGFQLREYVNALLDVRSSCLMVLGHIEDAKELDREGHTECAIAEVRELIERLSVLEAAVESRHWIEEDLCRVVKSTKAEQEENRTKNQQKMQKARANKTSRHDWNAVRVLEAKLLATGKADHDLASIIQARLHVPPSTYRAWRKKRQLNH